MALGFALVATSACGGSAQTSSPWQATGGSSPASAGQGAIPPTAGAEHAGSGAGGAPNAGGALGVAGSATRTAGAGGVSAAGAQNVDACAGPLGFADPDVERVVRRLAGVPSGPLLASDVAPITDLGELFEVFGSDLSCSSPELCPPPASPVMDDWITSLGGLECLPNVHVATFDSWFLRDFTPLAALSKLDTLYLGLAPDLSSLPPLPQVTNFGVFYTSGALSLLESLPNVTTLSLRAADLSAPDALAPFARLQHLQLLSLTRSHVTSVGALAGLTQLVEVDLGDNDISDLSPFVQNAAFGAGAKLSVYGNPVACDSDASILALRARGVVVNCN